jgi:hypothetical protein
MINKIKTYKVLYIVGILGILNTVTKLVLPNFNHGDGIVSFLFALPFTITGLLDWSTGPLFFLWICDGAPLWLIIGYFLSKKNK